MTPNHDVNLEVLHVAVQCRGVCSSCCPLQVNSRNRSLVLAGLAGSETEAREKLRKLSSSTREESVVGRREGEGVCHCASVLNCDTFINPRCFRCAIHDVFRGSFLLVSCPDTSPKLKRA